MSDGLTALASENLNPSLRSLLEDVQRGHIRVPRFQRPFIWSDSQRVELLRSIRDNMPIGSLLIWRTIRFSLASFPSIGPHMIPGVVEPAPATGWQYVLDGHQRLTTLLGLLMEPSVRADTDEDWDIQYSLEEQDYVFKRKFDKYKEFLPLLPLWTLLDGRLVNRQMRELRKRATLFYCTEEQMDEWEERANQLAYRFQQCRVPVVVMVSDDLALAARTFQRINSQGTPMGEAHLVAALTWTKDFDLRDNIERMRSDLPTGWQSVEEGVYLQVCKGLLGLDVTKTAQVDFAAQLFKDSTLLPRAGKALQVVLEWLANKIGVIREDLLPYMLQVVLMSVQIDRQQSSKVPPEFEDWFWKTSWSEVFSSATYRQVREEQEILDGMRMGKSNGSWIRADELPERFDFRSARVRLFALRLAMRPALFNGYGGHVNGRQLLQEYGRDALVRLFPVPSNANAELRRLLQGASNRFLLDPWQDRILRDRLAVSPSQVSDEELDSLFISREALLGLGDNNGLLMLLKERQKNLQSWDAAEWNRCALTQMLRP
jgi:hypothetical protein